jgi:hypothetical protein
MVFEIHRTHTKPEIDKSHSFENISIGKWKKNMFTLKLIRFIRVQTQYFNHKT